jgi:hypothetical protein
MSATLPHMAVMPPMLAYTIVGSIGSGAVPVIQIGQGRTKVQISPNAPANDSYWIVILDAKNPANKVQEFVVPGPNNTVVPSGLDQFMSNPAYLFAVVTQYLISYHVPQGDFYDYLVAHGAGRELQRLEQVNTSLGCGWVQYVSYLLTGQCGPPPQVAYELGSTSSRVLFLMSLMPLPNGQPPYSICDSNTFITRPSA